jgi:hypothetical protein
MVLFSGAYVTGQEAPSNALKPSFTMRISIKDGTAKVGTEIQITVGLTNTSAGQIELWRAYSGPPPYTVLVLDHAGKAAALTPVGIAFQKGEAAVRENGKVVRVFPSNGTLVRIAPGETATDAIAIQRQFDLSQPGTYTVQLERTDHATNLLVKSNAVSLTITP